MGPKLSQLANHSHWQTIKKGTVNQPSLSWKWQARGFFLTKTSGIHANFPTKFLLHFVYNLILSYMHCRKQPQNTSENKVNLGFAGLQWLLCAEPARLGNIASVKCELKNNRLMDLYLHRKERPYTGSFIWHFRSYLFIYLFTWVAFLIKSGQKKKKT